MEYAALVTSNKNLERNLVEYLSKLKGISVSEDFTGTRYFKDAQGRVEFLLELNRNIEKEFSYNFLPQNVAHIKAHFAGKGMILLDLGFRNIKEFSLVLENLLNSIVDLGMLKEYKIIIDDPFRGLLKLFEQKIQEIDV